MENYVLINGVTKTFPNNFKALDQLDLSIKQGEIFALLGPNGAGKSTLINTICGILNFESGKKPLIGAFFFLDIKITLVSLLHILIFVAYEKIHLVYQGYLLKCDI